MLQMYSHEYLCVHEEECEEECEEESEEECEEEWKEACKEEWKVKECGKRCKRMRVRGVERDRECIVEECDKECEEECKVEESSQECNACFHLNDRSPYTNRYQHDLSVTY